MVKDFLELSTTIAIDIVFVHSFFGLLSLHFSHFSTVMHLHPKLEMLMYASSNL